jgi:hypothetical protein
MATCRRCKGHLTDGHRCPKRPIFVVAEMIAWAIAGGLLSFALLAAFDPHNQAGDLDVVAIAVGAIAAVGINRVLRA